MFVPRLYDTNQVVTLKSHSNQVCTIRCMGKANSLTFYLEIFQDKHNELKEGFPSPTTWLIKVETGYLMFEDIFKLSVA